MRGFWGKTKAALVVVAGLCGPLAVVESGRAEDWRVGVDLFGGGFQFYSGGLGSLNSLPLLGSAGLELEGQISPVVSIFGRLGGGFDDHDDGSTWTANLEVGARIIMNPSDRVHIGWSFAFGGQLGRHEVGYSDRFETVDSQAGTLTVGVSAELALTKSLDLRFSADVAAMGYRHERVVDVRSDGTRDAHDAAALFGSFGVAPRIGLGLRF